MILGRTFFSKIAFVTLIISCLGITKYAQATKKGQGPKKSSPSPTSAPACPQILGVIPPENQLLPPDQSGLLDALQSLAVNMTNLNQLQTFLLDLEHLIADLQATPLGPDFGMSKINLLFLQKLITTEFSQKNKRMVAQNVNSYVVREKRGVKINASFLDSLEKLQQKILKKDKHRQKVMALSDQFIKMTTGSIYTEYVYNPYGQQAQDLFNRTNDILIQHRFFPPALKPKTPLSQEEIEILVQYVQAYLDDKMPSLKHISSALRLLKDYDQNHKTIYYLDIIQNVLHKALERLEAYSGEQNGKGLLTLTNREMHARIAVEILEEVFPIGELRRQRDADLTEETQALLLKTFLNPPNKDQQGPGSGFLFVLNKFYYILEEPSAYKTFSYHLEKLRQFHQDQIIPQHVTTLYAESLYLGFIRLCVDSIKKAILFGNDLIAMNALKEAGLATSVFKSSALMTITNKKQPIPLRLDLKDTPVTPSGPNFHDFGRDISAENMNQEITNLVEMARQIISSPSLPTFQELFKDDQD